MAEITNDTAPDAATLPPQVEDTAVAALPEVPEVPATEVSAEVAAPAVADPAVETSAVETSAVETSAVETPVAEAAAVVAKRKRGRPPKVVVEAAPVAEAAPIAKAPAAKAPKPLRAKPLVKAKAKAKPVAVAAPAPMKPAIKTKTVKFAVKRAAAPKVPAPMKETVIMATKIKTPEIAAKIQETFKDATEKAKVAFGETGEFAKGNLEAVVASSKILATGVKSLGETYVSETKSAYETMTADIKELTAVKSPTEFFELQSKLLRKNFDAAVATGSKKSEDMLKLVNEAFQPISTRMSLAMEKIKKAA